MNKKSHPKSLKRSGDLPMISGFPLEKRIYIFYNKKAQTQTALGNSTKERGPGE